MAKMKAQVLGVVTDEFEEEKNGQKTGRKLPFHFMEVIDMDAPEKEIIRVKINGKKAEVLLPEANSVFGKVAVLDVYFKTGRVHFSGVQKAA